MTSRFGDRLAAALREQGGLCVGLDPHPATLEAWGLPQTAAGAERFAVEVLEAAAGRVGVVKPQVSLFECYGASGFSALEQVLSLASELGLLVIADAKRGDIGSSNAGYARAWLGREAPFRCDALTVSPYLGVGALEGLRDAAAAADCGLFVLGVTSNPEAAPVQGSGTPTVSRQVVDAVAAWNTSAGGLGSYGIVFGATGAPAARGVDIRKTPESLPLLAPGFGAQGARLSDAAVLFPGCRNRLVANVSRSVTASGRTELPAKIEAALDALSGAWQQEEAADRGVAGN
ncbi:MAG: orotidine-5'-phosphate decarboxylase [Microbacteriaceae bacterium]|jgi:orotidine-5'-phosphate decarboxylase|nr:orotidine-5'-phosphate decarboxylase [Microbacteriaceae bacterium]MCI1206759.1 orotidine-5'-phosphate decarboxylase [Microbacteriaceae bacterium]